MTVFTHAEMHQIAHVYTYIFETFPEVTPPDPITLDGASLLTSQFPCASLLVRVHRATSFRRGRWYKTVTMVVLIRTMDPGVFPPFPAISATTVITYYLYPHTHTHTRQLLTYTG